jgi:hypothetical protein
VVKRIDRRISLADCAAIAYADLDQRRYDGVIENNGAAGRTMRWFGKEKPRETWEERAAAPAGDIEAAEAIRNICRSAAESAAFVGSFAARTDQAKQAVQKKHESENARYQRAARAAMEIAMKVSDELMRDAALKEIVELCLSAGDARTANILFRAVLTPSIRDGLLRDNPTLGS